MTDDEPFPVSEFEWLSLEHALLNGTPHPLDDEIEGRNIVVVPSLPNARMSAHTPPR